MKRSRTVQLAFMSSVPLLITACGGPRPDERLAYQDVQQCIADGKVSKEVCEQEYQAALQARAAQAHYPSYGDCAAQWDDCRPYVTSGGDHWFVPALAGFMIGRMLGHRDPNVDAPARGPTTAETLSRGGFGYSGAARSSWG